MRIERIELFNIGSYEGLNELAFNTDINRNIVLIGGKNGAGKTTLFSAMKVCLYGYMCFGYKNQNSYYSKNIVKLINNSAKINRPTKAYIKMHFSLNNNQGVDSYIMTRSWLLENTLQETVKVNKNGNRLTSEEELDFEKYFLGLLPPDLFDLYFFDGEKIVDFFLSEGSNNRLKDAFLKICGFDTFEIMLKNFKRMKTSSKSSSTNNDLLIEYLDNKNKVRELEKQQELLNNTYEDEINKSIGYEAEIKFLDKQFEANGCINKDEWQDKENQIKNEEKKRTQINQTLRRFSNEVLPFYLLKKQLIDIKKQIIDENYSKKLNNFYEVLDNEKIISLVGLNYDTIREVAFNIYGRTDGSIFDLSIESQSLILSQINGIINFDINKIYEQKEELKKSLDLSSQLREEVSKINVDFIRDYDDHKKAILEKSKESLEKQILLKEKLNELTNQLNLKVNELTKQQSIIAEEIKDQSIQDISDKAILLIDYLQKVLYREQISKVKLFFKDIIKQLIRKKSFIDDIEIDDKFNIYLYRDELIDSDVLYKLFSQKKIAEIENELGRKAINDLYLLSGNNDEKGIADYCLKQDSSIKLSILLDQNLFSNGEKQIFIMALYYSLIKLGKHEIPFVIDTPFARIDAEHRDNICNYFFKKLPGQIFILSTNEEISLSHLKILNENIATKYILENSDNKRTLLVQNSFFGGKA